jgi:hypothetical protein
MTKRAPPPPNPPTSNDTTWTLHENMGCKNQFGPRKKSRGRRRTQLNVGPFYAAAWAKSEWKGKPGASDDSDWHVNECLIISPNQLHFGQVLLVKITVRPADLPGVPPPSAAALQGKAFSDHQELAGDGPATWLEAWR